MKKENKIALTNGIALFAMFFGSGNLVFPLTLGSTAGHHIIAVWLAFLLAGVGLPFLGVFTMTLFKGDYWKFFSPLTKPLAFIVITFLLLIIGPLFAGPRTEMVTYGSFLELFPKMFSEKFFSVIYFAIVFLIVVKHTHFTQILGKLLGPIKISLFTILIITAIGMGIGHLSGHTPVQIIGPQNQITNALTTGYNTMDLLASLFFAGIIYQSILSRCKKEGLDFQQHAFSMTLKSCIIGAALLSLIYTGFMASAWMHSEALQGVPTVSIVSAIALLVFGPHGAWFVCVCVGLTCLATASALVEVFSHYLHRIVFRSRVPRLVCLFATLCFMYGMSLVGFDEIIALASPILNYLYPLLIIYCIGQLFYFFHKKRTHSKPSLNRADT